MSCFSHCTHWFLCRVFLIAHIGFCVVFSHCTHWFLCRGISVCTVARGTADAETEVTLRLSVVFLRIYICTLGQLTGILSNTVTGGFQVYFSTLQPPPPPTSTTPHPCFFRYKASCVCFCVRVCVFFCCQAHRCGTFTQKHASLLYSETCIPPLLRNMHPSITQKHASLHYSETCIPPLLRNMHPSITQKHASLHYSETCIPPLLRNMHPSLQSTFFSLSTTALHH